MIRAITLAITLALAGCAGPRLVKMGPNGPTDAAYAQDKAQCEYEVALHDHNPNAVAGGINNAVLVIQCLYAKGYRKAE